MYSDWSAELAADSPVLSIPWVDESGRLTYIDLREGPERIDEVPEAAAHPALRRSLLILNSAQSSVSTAKCDVWPLDQSDVAACCDLLDWPADSADEVGGPRFGFGSYIDTVLRDHQAFASHDLHLELISELARAAAALDLEDSTTEFVLRFCSRASAQQLRVGYAVTMYVYGVAASEARAYAAWGEAQMAVSDLLLGLLKLKLQGVIARDDKMG